VSVVNAVCSSMATCRNNRTWCRITSGHQPTNEPCSTTQPIFKTRFTLHHFRQFI